MMIDETTDLSNTKQVVLVFRWVDSELSVHEEFLGLYQTDSVKAATLLKIIEDSFIAFKPKAGSVLWAMQL